jgi:CRISPR-associated protein Cmr2
MTNDKLWQTKLAARLHDPAEKALVLLRDPEGHENGTSRALRRLLGFDQLPPDHLDPDNDEVLARVLFKKGLPVEIYRNVQRADWWAAAADRPQFPMQEITVTTNTGERKTRAVAPWARVHWTKRPVLIHPLTGDQIDLESLATTEVEAIKQRSFQHFSELLVKLGGKDVENQDWRKILLAFWRFGPELSVTKADTDDSHKLGVLWELLPADTRVPDHSIWDHLDLTSAFAGAFAADPNGDAALLAFSVGPVQSFIAAARKVEDLWAGSHLLSRLAWEAMRPICETLGPDAILFPRLRGIPQVDVWLREMGLPDALFADCDWMQGSTDANPLFVGALPNRFVAVVPASQAAELAARCGTAAREWLLAKGLEVVDLLLEEAGFRSKGAPRDETVHAYRQMREQLEGFPEIYWAAVPFSLIRCGDEAKQRDLDVSPLLRAMAPFFGVEEGKPCGFLATPAWQVLCSELKWDDGTTFHAPNPGVLYPAVYDLVERLLAAAKAVRPFTQSRQEGWRDSLTGETEWLTTDPAQLGKSYRQQADTLWACIAKRKPAWAKKGEHLGALSAIKRLWPTLFAREVSQATGKEVGRFVVSTHTMALAHQLDQWLEKGGPTAEGFDEKAKGAESVALPRRLIRRHRNNSALDDARRIPALLDDARESDDEKAWNDAQKVVKETLGKALDKKEIKLETYYALIMMDGDRMGAILSGDEESGTAISYRDSFHPQVRTGFKQHAASNDLIHRYGEQRRPLSPNRHLAISGALNDFSQTVVRHVVEMEHLGKLIYAGGEDVLAMLPVADMLSCMQRLRHAYSGTVPEDETKDWSELRKDRDKLHCKDGFAYLNGRLMRMMGRNATASCGGVIAHHQAPLSAVLRELREAEKRAKTEGGRDAFSITVIKRSGGALHLTAKWGEPLALLNDMRRYLSADETSRRAVYRTLGWLRDLPDPKENPDMLESLLAYQLARQSGGDTAEKVPQLARRLTALASSQGDARAWLSNFLCVAEFLARETRAVQVTNGDRT